jgi:Uma2 family endonuclease
MTTTVTLPPVAPAALLIAEEFVRLYPDHYVELVKGVVQEMPVPTMQHGKICMTIGYLIMDHAFKHDIGHVMSNDSFVKTRSNPDSVRGADICFISYERLPRGKAPGGLIDVAPDLVVEVRSPSNNWGGVFAKVGDYLEAGVRVVIILDDASGSASVYRAEEFQQIFHNGDELTVPDVLPGFAVAVHRLFD